jgi:peptidoglycan/LPS O-acetylase OafA/YrhL
VTSIRQLAAQTPAQRARQIDLLRAIAITAVVLGHWLVIAVEYDQRGDLTGFSVLGELTWAHPLSWLFQVMPVFFMVGGFANAASLSAYRRRAGDPHPERGGTADAGWLLARSARLVRPTTVLLLVLAGGALAARLAGADPDQVATAVWLASLPLWFLVAYLAVIALTPLMYSLHRRAGLAVPLVLLLLVLAGDLLRFHNGDEAWAYGNLLFGWLAIHQVGFWWRDGRLPTGARAWPVLLCGLAGLLALTVLGPYPVSMVTVPGESMQNSSPPSLALLALATSQLSLALLLRGPCERWLRRRRPWTAVVAVNSVILTVFLWHLVAVVLTALALAWLDLLPTPPVDSPQWLLWQVPWVGLLAVVLAGLVAVFGRVEARAAAPAPDHRLRWPVGGPPAPGWLVVAAATGYAAVVSGLLWQAVAGRADHGPFALPTGALLLYLAGAAILGLPRRSRSSPSRNPADRAGQLLDRRGRRRPRA